MVAITQYGFTLVLTANCSEAYNGASLQQVEIRIYNRKTQRWDTKLFNYNDAKGSGVERYFELEEEPKEGKIKIS